jgi:DNA polymerase III epsilon subunit-like protein
MLYIRYTILNLNVYNIQGTIMKLLFLDLETTGFPTKVSFDKYHPYTQVAYYDTSRVVQLALIVYESVDDHGTGSNTDTDADDSEKLRLCDTDDTKVVESKNTNKFKLIAEYDYIIKPDKFEIKNPDIHGITQQMAEFAGVEFKQVIADIKKEFATGDLLIAHNIIFDKNVLLSEMYRYKLFEECKLFKAISTFCTSKQCANLTKIRFNAREYKQPKLSELYEFLFKEKAKNLHNALYDTRAMVRIFMELLRVKFITLE